MKSPVFITSLQSSHSVLIPLEIAKPFITLNQKRVIVEISFKDTHIKFHAALLKRKEQFYVMFSQKKQKQLGVLPNDYFNI